jgi:branched-chain amino acid transport system substrate-binding protein
VPAISSALVPRAVSRLALLRRWTAAVFAVLAVASCAERAPITIGLAGPLTDPVGAPMRLAAELAIAEINAAGGIRGRPLALLALDDHGDPDSAIVVAGLLRTSAAVAVIGHVWSGTTLAAGPVYGEGTNPIPVITPSSSAPNLTLIGDHLFRVCPTDLAHGSSLAAWARSGLGLDRVAVIYRNDDYGRGIHRAFRATFLRQGGTVLGDFPILDVASDAGPYLDLLARNGQAQALVIAGDGADALGIMAQAVDRGLSLPVLGGDGLEGIEEAGAVSEGVYLSVAWLPDGRRPAARTFLDAWASRHPDQLPPNQPAAATWDIVHLLATALRQAGPDRARLRAALAQVGSEIPPHEGATGRIGFTPEGDLLQGSVDLAVVRGGRLVRVAPR